MKRLFGALLLFLLAACASGGQDAAQAPLPEPEDRMAERGDEYLQMGDVKEAKHRYELALKITMKNDDQPRNAAIALRLARVALLERDYELARAYLDSAKLVAQKEGLDGLAADAALTESSLLVETGKPADAVKLLQSQKGGNAAAVANALGMAEAAQNNMAAAKGYFEQSLSAATSAKDIAAQSSARVNLAQALLRMNDPDGALAHLKAALELDKEAKAAVAIGETLHLIGRTYEAKKDYDNAAYFYRRALMVNSQTGMPGRTDADKIAAQRVQALRAGQPQ
ncbi:MAG: tetratricopeptide repeat protein [Nitrospinae bacterium]|nr:tetratricopeptide repeat protein [Nitrospinota bacterium]